MERKLVRAISKLSQIILRRIGLQEKLHLFRRYNFKPDRSVMLWGCFSECGDWESGEGGRKHEERRICEDSERKSRAANVELTPQDQSECYWLDFTKP